MHHSDPKSIFLEAIEQPTPEARTAMVKQRCDGDSALYQRVAALLAAHDERGNFLRGSESHPPASTTRIVEGVGSRIGPFKLIQRIGAGGMGVVFVAEQKTPVRRRVALKIIKPGLDSEQLINRFEAERQALALMDHPNIAKVFDAGTTAAGRPFFVMELVNGESITDYCNSRELGIRERLGLFIPICQAIHHAHQKGIIHRDLKPSNILVAQYDGVNVRSKLVSGSTPAAR
jgi:serine/threonine protein kinase